MRKNSRLSVSNIWFFYVRTHPVGLSTTPWVAFSPTSGPWGTSELDPRDPAEPNIEAFLQPGHQLMKVQQTLYFSDVLNILNLLRLFISSKGLPLSQYVDLKIFSKYVQKGRFPLSYYVDSKIFAKYLKRLAFVIIC